MSEIEQKRKELQDDVYNSSGDNTEVCSSRDFAEHILEGFNLGVEMARKEFLEFLDICQAYKCEIDGSMECEDCYVTNKNIAKMIRELKQSLEVKQ